MFCRNQIMDQLDNFYKTKNKYRNQIQRITFLELFNTESLDSNCLAIDIVDNHDNALRWSYLIAT